MDTNYAIHPVAWSNVKEYVAAGGLVQVVIGDDLTTISVEVIYGGVYKTLRREMTIRIICMDCCYLDMRRRDDHEPGAAIILDAFLHDQSPLINQLFTGKLEAKAGSLMHEVTKSESIAHLEIIGEVSLDILCTGIELLATEMHEFNIEESIE